MGLSDLALSEFTNVTDRKTKEFSEPAEMKVAYLLMREGRHKEATVAFTRFLKNHPKSKHAAYCQYCIGFIADVEGDKDAASLAYQQVIQEHPRSRWAREAKKRIDQHLEAVMEDILEY